MKNKILKTVCLGVSMSSLFITSCQPDLNEVWRRFDKIEKRVAVLENKVNDNVQAIRKLAEAENRRKAIASVVEKEQQGNTGFEISFTDGSKIFIQNGKDGRNGINGSNGRDGVDGKTPLIEIKKDIDGIYYWTINGKWLMADGKKVRVTGENGRDGKDGINGTNGRDGQNGANGITPKFKFENNKWYVSYDNEKNWRELGNFDESNGKNTIVDVSFQNNKITIKLSNGQTFTFDGKLTAIDIPNGTTIINDEQYFGMTTITSVTIPNTVKWIGTKAFYGCTLLSSINIPSSVKYIDELAFANCHQLHLIKFEGKEPPMIDYSQSMEDGSIPVPSQDKLSFYNVPENVVVYVPKGCKKKYMSILSLNFRDKQVFEYD